MIRRAEDEMAGPCSGRQLIVNSECIGFIGLPQRSRQVGQTLSGQGVIIDVSYGRVRAQEEPVATDTRSPRFVRFGVFEIDLKNRELRKRGLKIRLQQQPFEVLVALLERPGEVVTRDELRERIWPEDTFVDFDHSLRTAILKIRRSLGDAADSPRFIETVPRQGYRFIPPGEAELIDGELEADHRLAFRLFRWDWAVLSMMVLFLVAVGIWHYSTRQPESNLQFRVVPLTSHPDNEWMGSFSPDGNQVTFTRCEPGTWILEGNCDLYVKQLYSEQALQLTTYPWLDWRGAWSPDGRWIAFLRYPPEGLATYFVISPLGGPERKLMDTVPPGAFVPFFGNVISWMPDGRRLVVTLKPSEEEPLCLTLVALETGEQRRLTSPPLDILGDSNPAVSPDGHLLVFSRMTLLDSGDLFLLKLSDGAEILAEPVRITSSPTMYGYPIWSDEGRAIIFTSPEGLWRMAVSEKGAGEAERIVLPEGQQLMHPAISGDGRYLAYSRANLSEDIVRLGLSAPGRAIGASKKFASSTRNDVWPEYSPDGERIAFVTDRSGRAEIWTCDAEDSNLLRVTSTAGPLIGKPAWSPDRGWIAFPSNPDGLWGVFVVSARGGVPRRLVTARPGEGWFGGFSVAWSDDGNWIYYCSGGTEGYGLWKVPSTGGEPVRLSKESEESWVNPVRSDEFYFLKPLWQDHHSLWKLRLMDGSESKVLDSVFRHNYSVGAAGVYFIAGREPEDNCYHVEFLEFASGQITRLTEVEDTSFGMSIAPDGGSLLYTQRSNMVSDVMLVENFR